MKNFKNAFNWDINKTEILDVNGDPIKGYNNITRDDDGSTIAVMKETYCPMTTQEFTNVAEAISKETGFKIAGYEDWQTNKDEGRNMGGRRHIVTAQIESNNKLHIGGSMIEGFLTIGVGFDGGRSFYMGHASNYLRCTNEFGAIVTDFKSKLTKNNMFRVEEIIKNVGLYSKYEKELYESFKQFENVKIDDKLITECVNRLVKLTKEERADNELIKTAKYNKMCDMKASIYGEIEDLGANAWGLFNGVTHYTTHIAKVAKEDHFGNMFGTKAEMNNTGYKMCMELALA